MFNILTGYVNFAVAIFISMDTMKQLDAWCLVWWCSLSVGIILRNSAIHRRCGTMKQMNHDIHRYRRLFMIEVVATPYWWMHCVLGLIRHSAGLPKQALDFLYIASFLGCMLSIRFFQSQLLQCHSAPPAAMSFMAITFINGRRFTI